MADSRNLLAVTRIRVPVSRRIGALVALGQLLRPIILLIGALSNKDRKNTLGAASGVLYFGEKKWGYAD